MKIFNWVFFPHFYQGKVDNKALKDVQDKLKEAKRENADLNTQLKVLQKNADKSSNTEADVSIHAYLITI